MTSERDYYAVAKKILWPHTIIPFGVMILIDYVQMVASLVKIAAACWIMVQAFGFAIGFWAGGMVKVSRGQLLEFWQSFFNLRIAVALPTIALGRDMIDWLLTDIKSEEKEPGTEQTVSTESESPTEIPTTQADKDPPALPDE